MTTCQHCGETLTSNDHATEHAGICPVMNGEPYACEFCGHDGDLTLLFGLLVCVDYDACLTRQAAAQPHDYELAVLAQDRAAYDKERKEAQEHV